MTTSTVQSQTTPAPQMAMPVIDTDVHEPFWKTLPAELQKIVTNAAVQAAKEGSKTTEDAATMPSRSTHWAATLSSYPRPSGPGGRRSPSRL